jgi:hypothetical protein
MENEMGGACRTKEMCEKFIKYFSQKEPESKE